MEEEVDLDQRLREVVGRDRVVLPKPLMPERVVMIPKRVEKPTGLRINTPRRPAIPASLTLEMSPILQRR